MKLEPAVVKKLKAANFRTPLEILFHSPEDIATRCSWTIEQAKNTIAQIATTYNISTLSDTIQGRLSKSPLCIPTFSSGINQLLNGGFHTQRIYEIYGEYRSGKTQLCHALATSYQALPKLNNWTEILYIDTENTFRPERIVEIAGTQKMNPRNVLDHVTVVKLPNYSAQQIFFRKLFETIQTRRVGLLVIDSFTNHFRKEIAEDFERYGPIKNILVEELETLVRIRDNFPTCIILTNQVRSEFNPLSDSKVRPVADAILGNFASEIVFLRVTEEEKRFFRIVRSLYGSEGEVAFNLGPAGLVDL